jgi:hypothetical protein
MDIANLGWDAQVGQALLDDSALLSRLIAINLGRGWVEEFGEGRELPLSVGHRFCFTFVLDSSPSWKLS